MKRAGSPYGQLRYWRNGSQHWGQLPCTGTHALSEQLTLLKIRTLQFMISLRPQESGLHHLHDVRIKTFLGEVKEA